MRHAYCKNFTGPAEQGFAGPCRFQTRHAHNSTVASAILSVEYRSKKGASRDTVSYGERRLVQAKTHRSKFAAMRSSTGVFDAYDIRSKLPIFSFRVDGWAEIVYTTHSGVGTR